MYPSETQGDTSDVTAGRLIKLLSWKIEAVDSAQPWQMASVHVCCFLMMVYEHLRLMHTSKVQEERGTRMLHELNRIQTNWSSC